MSSLSNDVKDLFQPRSDLLTLRREAAEVLNRDEWTDYRKVVEKFDGERRFAERQFELEYSNRIDRVRRRLIDEAGSVERRLTFKRFPADGFNKDAINRRAHIEVSAAHKDDLASIDRRECEALRPILENAQERKAHRDMPIKAFQRATDRRTGPERRVRSWDR